MELEGLIQPLIAGLVVAIPTVAAIKTDIGWLKKELGRLDSALIRAHERIDQLEREARN